jgi:hypothetical protein
MNEIIIPKRIFIVPYRNRPEHKFFFCKQMDFILENENDYEIHFSHQCDSRPFNRGSTKNIGFIVMKEKYPTHYKDITFIFNDVDTLPFHKIFDYQTTNGIVKHYYGFDYALGGIVVIKGGDFEKLNGYPNFWSWGNEDSVIQKRCINNNIIIDRTNFYPIGSPEILQLFDGVKRLVSPRDYTLQLNDSGLDGLSSIKKLTYSIDTESLNPKDNKFLVNNKNIYVINILSFLTGRNSEFNEYYEYDLREPTTSIINPNKERTKKRDIVNSEWKNINDNDSKCNKETNLYKTNINRNINVFSQEYATHLGLKPRATKSVNIRLGGVI